VLDGFSSRTRSGALSFALATPATGWSMQYDTDGASPSATRPYFIGSVTKLYTAAIVMQLWQEGMLRLDDSIAAHLDGDLLAGIHVYREHDYSEQITVRDLLMHTSGLANYLMQPRHDGGSLFSDALTRDRGWTFDQALGVARSMRPAFAPGSARRAHFSHTNYALLGRIIEERTGMPWEAAVVERITGPLGLTATWPFSLDDLDRYDSVAPMLHGAQAVRLPLTMASVRSQGGIVSTAEDGVAFLRALFGGALFGAEAMATMMREWRRLNHTTSAGIGIMRHRGSALRSGGRGIEILGHPSSTGSVLYCSPADGLYLSGTVGRMRDATASHAVVIALVRAVRDIQTRG
jgi:D-alanyl-D-alanine carboxypeptidase